MEGLHSTSTAFWATEKAKVRQPSLVLYPLLEIAKNARVSLVGLREGKGEAVRKSGLPML